MATLMSNDEVVQCVKQELELTGVAEIKHAKPDLSHLFPELKFTMVETLLLYTRGNQAKAARMLGINRGTLGKIYNQRDR